MSTKSIPSNFDETQSLGKLKSLQTFVQVFVKELFIFIVYLIHITFVKRGRVAEGEREIVRERERERESNGKRI